MIRRKRNTKFIVCIVALFIGASFIPVSLTALQNNINGLTTRTLKNMSNPQTNNSVILICEGKDDFLQPAFERVANLAYQTFRKLGYTNDDIYYLSRNTSFQGIDKKDTIENIRYAITYWLKNRSTDDSKYFIVLIDHGNYTDGQVTVNDGYIYPETFSNWLNNITNYSTGTILISSYYSGKFIKYLSNPKRIVMTSTDDSSKGYSDFKNDIVGTAFFKALNKGISYGKAWEAADSEMDKLIHEIYIHGLFEYTKYKLPEVFEKRNSSIVWWIIQWCFWQYKFWCGNPQIDDNGDGIGHGTKWQDKLPLYGDGNLALNIYP